MGASNNSGLDGWQGLYVRERDQLVEAQEEDVLVAKSYPEWPDKGQVVDGRRITIMTKKLAYPVNEKVRIIHVLEAPVPGYKVYVMGPKRIFNEYVNGQVQGDEMTLNETDAFSPAEYDGRVLGSPATDFNFEITSYSFADPGVYEIAWQPGKWKSNILRIEVQ